MNVALEVYVFTIEYDAVGSLTVMAGPAKARLSSISSGITSWLGSTYGRLRLRSWQLKPDLTGLKMSVHSRK